MTEIKQGRHNVILENRSKLVLTGITDVDNFDDTTITLFTELGELIIRGRKLHINLMNVETGDLTVEGDICSLVYGDKDRKKKPSTFGKLFR